MDNASKKAALKELRQLYGYDMAVVKQNGTDIGDETSELESLALYNLNKRIVEAITEFSSYVGEESSMVSGSIAVLMGAAGDLIASLEIKHGKVTAGKAARFGKKYLELQYIKRFGAKK